MRNNIIEVALDYLACGIDPAKSTIFVQSSVPELTELSFYYMNLVTLSRLQRNPTVKSEIKMRDFEKSIPVGFLTYPISQAADITAFEATTVPVGEDQEPMLEQCKEIVRKFNSIYGETLELIEYSPEIDKYLRIICFPTFKGHCGCMLFDISETRISGDKLAGEQAVLMYLKKILG